MNKQRTINSILVVVLVVVFSIAGYSYGKKQVELPEGDNAVQKASAQFIESLTKGDVEATYKLSSKAYQARNTKDYVRTIATTLKSDSPKIGDEEVFFGTDQAARQALYVSTVSNLPPNSLNRTTGNFVIRLVVEDGQWKVDSSQVY